MAKTGYNPRGLIKILEKIQQKLSISADITDKYLLTHPVSQDRITYIENYLRENPSADKPTPVKLNDRFKMIKAKIYGFLQ